MITQLLIENPTFVVSIRLKSCQIYIVHLGILPNVPAQDITWIWPLPCNSGK